MQVWQLSATSNDRTQYIAANQADVKNRVFHTAGQPKTWDSRPQLLVFAEKGKKKPKPLGDVSFIVPGSIILNAKAYAALHAYLAQFGQFLEAECEGEICYLYNVTTIIACVDKDNSKLIGGALFHAAFYTDAVPQDAQIFKDPLMLKTAIFINEPAKVALEGLIASAQITGLEFEATL